MGKRGPSIWDGVPGLAGRLLALAADRVSASQMASALGAEFREALAGRPLSRNAVIAKIGRAERAGNPLAKRRRHGHGGKRGPQRAKGSAPPPGERERPMPKPQASESSRASPSRVIAPARELTPPLPLLVGRAEDVTARLTDAMCCWPSGEVGTDSFAYCGHPRWPGTAFRYCEGHAALARAGSTLRYRPGARP